MDQLQPQQLLVLKTHWIPNTTITQFQNGNAWQEIVQQALHLEFSCIRLETRHLLPSISTTTKWWLNQVLTMTSINVGNSTMLKLFH